MKYPKEILVKSEEEGTDDQYYFVSTDPVDMIVIGEKVRVARYRLVETVEICGDVRIGKARK